MIDHAVTPLAFLKEHHARDMHRLAHDLLKGFADIAVDHPYARSDGEGR